MASNHCSHGIQSVFVWHQISVFMASNQCSYGIKSVFSRGRSSGLVRLKKCFQHCNAIEKDRSLSRKWSFPTQRTGVCQAAKSIFMHWPARRHQLLSELDASPYTGLSGAPIRVTGNIHCTEGFGDRSSWCSATDFSTWAESNDSKGKNTNKGWRNVSTSVSGSWLVD